MKVTREASVYLAILFLLIILSAGTAYYRYVMLGDFAYFLTEEEIPDRFDFNSY